MNGGANHEGAGGARDYYPQLDGVRALAVVAVLIGHLIPLPLLQKIVSWGDMGVVLFFCLSGFLITGILLRVQDPDLSGRAKAIRTFYLRRTLRIFPIYYLTLFVALAVGYAPVRDHFFRLATYTLNVPGLPPTDQLGAVSHFWSLSVEEQFYLFWPLLVVFFPRDRIRVLVWGLIGASLAYKLSLALLDAPYKLIFASLWGCLDSLGLGALLAVGWHNRARRTEVVGQFVRVGRVAVGCWIFMTAVRIWADIDPYYEGYRWFGVVYFAASALSFTGLIASAAAGTTGWAGHVLGNVWMVRMGRISYGVYVYHFFFPYVLLWMMAQQYIHFTSRWHYTWTSVIGSVVVATLSWWLIEKPILALKDRFSHMA